MKIRNCTNKDVQLLNRNVNNIKEYLVVEKDKEVVGIFKYYFYDKSLLRVLYILFNYFFPFFPPLFPLASFPFFSSATFV